MSAEPVMGEHLGESGPTLLEVLAVILRARRWTIWLPASLAVLTGLVVLLLPRNYTSSASFIPQRTQSPLGRLAGLAAQFGVAVPGQNGGDSEEFYADLVVSREILARIASDSFHQVEERPAESLVELLGATGSTEAATLQDAVERLRHLIAVSTDPKTSVVTVGVTTRWPLVSTGIVKLLLAEVNEFDLHTRQTQASAERAFVEGRLAEIKSELRDAENRLQGFLANNREYRNSPALQFQYDRLSRDVTQQQQVETTLQQDYEQARIDEVRDTPRITVVERPLIPALPDSRRVVLRVALAGLVGVVIAWPLVLCAEGLRRARILRKPELEAVLEQVRSLVPYRSRSKRGN